MRILHRLANKIYASKIFKWLDRHWYGYPKKPELPDEEEV